MRPDQMFAHHPDPLAASSSTFSLQNIRLLQNSRVLFENLYWEAHAGQCWAVLSPSNETSSSLLQMLVGLQQPTAGNLQVLGQTPNDAVYCSKIGWMPFPPLLPGNLTVRELLELHSSHHASTLPAVDTLQRAGISCLAHQPISNLSHEHLRHLQWATLMCSDPSLLVLDQPTLDFSAEARDTFWNCIQTSIGHRTVVYSTVDPTEAQKYSTHILNLSDFVQT